MSTNKKTKIIIFSIVLGAFGLFFINKFRFTIKERPKLVKTMLEMDKIRYLLSKYKVACGKYPASIESIDKLSEIIKNKNCVELSTEGNNLMDQWGNIYFYKSNANGFRLLSAGSEWIETSNNREAEKIKKDD